MVCYTCSSALGHDSCAVQGRIFVGGLGICMHKYHILRGEGRRPGIATDIMEAQTMTLPFYPFNLLTKTRDAPKNNTSSTINVPKPLTTNRTCTMTASRPAHKALPASKLEAHLKYLVFGKW